MPIRAIFSASPFSMRWPSKTMLPAVTLPDSDLQQSRYGLQGGGLARPVAPQEGHDVALGHFQRNPLEHQYYVGVLDFDVVQDKQWH